MKIELLRKTDAESVLPELFEILHSNMSRIAPSGRSYDEEYSLWLSSVKPALEKAPRQILLLRDGDQLAGFFQYYVNDGIFMMEEIQFCERYHGSGIFEELYRYLVKIIPDNTRFVEAYTDIRNARSIAILNHLGLEAVCKVENSHLYHFRGPYKNLVTRYGNTNSIGKGL